MYCVKCDKYVKGKKSFNWIIFLAGVLFFGVGAVLYLGYYFLIKPVKCEVCNSKV